MLGEESAKQLDVLWSVMFVIISVIYRPIEQLLSRTIAERRARGSGRARLRVPMLIQASFALIFLAVALALHGELVNDVFEGESALYYVLVVGTLAYAASYFARGWLAGHQRFGLFGALVLMESTSRICFAIAVALGIASGQTAVALGIAAAPFVSLVVVPAAFARSRGERAGRNGASSGRGLDQALAERDAPAGGTLITVDEADAALAGPGTEGVQETAAHDDLSLRRGGGFAVLVSSIMLSEQTLLNGAVLTVDATSRNAVLAGIVFNVLLIARAPLQLFQAIQTSLLPHLTGLEATAGHEAFARAIRVTILAIAAFAVAVALGLLVLGPFALRARVLRAELQLQPLRAGADRRRHGPAPDLWRAQPGGARTRPRTRRRPVLGVRGGAVHRVDVQLTGQRTAAARRDRLCRRDGAARRDAGGALPARHAQRARRSIQAQSASTDAAIAR